MSDTGSEVSPDTAICSPRPEGAPSVGGRPSVMTEQRETLICDVLREGGTRRNACKCAGISEDTFTRHLKRSEAFALMVVQAEGEAERHAIGVIRAAMPTTWQASAWWLERRRGREWARGAVGEARDVIQHLTDDQLLRLMASEIMPDPEELTEDFGDKAIAAGAGLTVEETRERLVRDIWDSLAQDKNYLQNHDLAQLVRIKALLQG
jgi:hypothetical protein